MWSVRSKCCGSVTLLLAVAVLITLGCNRNSADSPQVKRIVILTNGTSPFWDAAKKGAQDAATALKLEEAGLTVMVDTNDFKVEGQLTKLKNYANSSDIAAVGISVTDSNNPVIAEELKKLRDAGIKVITIDSDVDRSTGREGRFAYVGSDNVTGGLELGKAAKGLRPDGGTYATFVGLKGAANAKERRGGFAKGAGEKFELVEDLGDGGDPNVARSNVKDALDRHSDLDVLVGIWSYNAPAIVDTVKSRNIRDQVTIVAFDAEPIAIEHMEEGMLDAMIVQNPYQMGYQGVRLMKALLEDDQSTINEMLPNLGDTDGDIYDTGLKVVVPDDNKKLSKDHFDSKTEYFLLSDFKAWLKKYRLTGS